MNRLIIVGNGFDLAHGLKTKYSDFINWYWNSVKEQLIKRPSMDYRDELLSIKQISSFTNVPHNPEQCDGRGYVSFLQKYPHEYKVLLSPFLKKMDEDIDCKGWVDIEEEYYQFLTSCLKVGSVSSYSSPVKLNAELYFLKIKLAEYLSIVLQNPQEDVIIHEIKSILLMPFSYDDIAVAKKEELDDHVEMKWKEDEVNFKKYSYLFDVNPFVTNSALDIKRKYKSCVAYCKEKGNQYKDLPVNFLLPENIMLLNFNYTFVADKYCENNEKCIIDHIHGTVESPDKMIFGYGDELDDDYKSILKKNDNEYLENVKSIRYLETNNYRKMLSFIESAPFQVYIMGHSCGNSDRTLLNTIFEHQNCVSIKPFYYKRLDGSDDYVEIVKNISRNFKDMKMMRDKVVNKEYCIPLPQLN